jgi:hypothetical protein
MSLNQYLQPRIQDPRTEELEYQEYNLDLVCSVVLLATPAPLTPVLNVVQALTLRLSPAPLLLAYST